MRFPSTIQSIVRTVIFGPKIKALFYAGGRDILRSVDLRIKGSVKSRAFLLRRDTRFPSPSERRATTHVATN